MCLLLLELEDKDLSQDDAQVTGFEEVRNVNQMDCRVTRIYMLAKILFV